MSQKEQDGLMQERNETFHDIKLMSHTLLNVPPLDKAQVYHPKTTNFEDLIEAREEYEKRIGLLKNDLLKYKVDPHNDILKEVNRYLDQKHRADLGIQDNHI